MASKGRGGALSCASRSMQAFSSLLIICIHDVLEIPPPTNSNTHLRSKYQTPQMLHTTDEQEQKTGIESGESNVRYITHVSHSNLTILGLDWS